VIEGARSGRAEKRLQFGEGQFNRIEVWTVRRQESQPSPRRFNRRTHFGLFVGGEIVEHDHIARLQGRDQNLLDVGAKRDGVHGAVEHGRRGHLGGPKGRDDRVRFPMAARRVVADPRAPGASSIAAQQVGGHAGFIHEHVLAGIVNRLRVSPLPAGGGHVRPTLFVGVYRFF